MITATLIQEAIIQKVENGTKLYTLPARTMTFMFISMNTSTPLPYYFGDSKDDVQGLDLDNLIS